MDEKRLSFSRRVGALVLCALVFLGVYNFSAWYTGTLAHVPSFRFNFEKHIPFVPWTLIPYLTSSLFFCAVFFICKSAEELATLSKRLLLIIVVAGISYLLFPLKFSLPKPKVTHSGLRFLFGFLEEVDSPYNQSPSLHVAFAFLFWTVFRNSEKKWRAVWAVLLAALALSTLTTYQHHFVDIVTGAILALFSFILFPASKTNWQQRNIQVANWYFLIGWTVVLGSLLLAQHFSSLWLFLLWPALVMFLMGGNYALNRVHFLKDKNGVTPAYKKVLYAPYVLVYRAFWQALPKTALPAEIFPHVYISAKLRKSQIQNFAVGENTFVYDLSAELEEHALIRNSTPYVSVPSLDIGAFNPVETKKLVSKIAAQYSRLPAGGKILIHCTMGLSRSAAIGILVTQKVLSLSLPEATALVTSRNKGTVIHAYLRDFLKTIHL